MGIMDEVALLPNSNNRANWFLNLPVEMRNDIVLVVRDYLNGGVVSTKFESRTHLARWLQGKDAERPRKPVMPPDVGKTQALEVFRRIANGEYRTEEIKHVASTKRTDRRRGEPLPRQAGSKASMGGRGKRR